MYLATHHHCQRLPSESSLGVSNKRACLLHNNTLNDIDKLSSPYYSFHGIYKIALMLKSVYSEVTATRLLFPLLLAFVF